MKRLNKIIIIICMGGFLFFNLTGFTQEWIVRYNGPGNLEDGAMAVAVDKSGNIYVTGASATRISFLDIVTIKYRPNGEVVWIARYNGPANYDDIPVKLVLDQKGNIYITGTTLYPQGQYVESDFITLKYDSSGNLRWAALYDGPGSWLYDLDMASALVVDSFGNVYVTGQSSGGRETFLDYAVIKYDSLGRARWVRRYETEGWDQPWDITLDDSNNIYVTGGTEGGGPTHYDYLTLKYSPDGQLLGAMVYSGEALSFDVARAVIVDKQGYIYVTGNSTLSLPFNMGIVTIKHNPEGKMLWKAVYPDAEVVGMLCDGNYIYVYGSLITSNGQDMLLVKYDSSGSEIWSQTYNGGASVDDVGIKAALSSSGYIYITGGSGEDFVTIKYDSNGQALWIKRFDGGLSDIPHDLAVDSLNNVIVTGESFDSLTSWDYVTIKYSSMEEITEREVRNLQIDLKVVSEGENIRIKYWLPNRAYVNLKLYNISGELIKIIFSGIKEKGNHSEYLRKERLGNGIYILTLESSYFKIVKKFIILK